MPRKFKEPDLAPFVPGVDRKIASEIWAHIYQKGSASSFMAFKNPDKTGKYGPERLELKEVYTSGSQIDGLSPDLTRLILSSGAEIHVAFRDQNGDLTGLHAASKMGEHHIKETLLTKDRLGRPWAIVVADGASRITGKEPLVRLATTLSPLLQRAEEHIRGASNPFDDLPVTFLDLPSYGRMDTSRGQLNFIESKKIISPSDLGMTPKGFNHLLQGLNLRLERAVDRELEIQAIIERHLNMTPLEEILAGETIDLKEGFYPDHNTPIRRIFENACQEITMSMMTGLRDAGLLEKCPNSANRMIRSMESWNKWLDGGYDGKERYGYRPFEDSPAFKILRNTLIEVSVDMHHDKTAPDTSARPQREIIEETLENVRQRVIGFFCTEECDNSFIIGDNLQSQENGERFILAGSFLTPVLAKRGASYLSDPIPVPVLREPPYVRHIEMQVPSGRLLIADWFRIKGFNEGLKTFVENEFHEIELASGLDERAKDYFEKAGLCIVQVGNSSPRGYEIEDGIYRFGHLDEDNEVFWTEDDERTDVQMPNEVAKTCTDLWANCIADRDTVIKILEASGEYSSREDASDAIDAYAASEYTVSEMGITDTLHLYVPTGAGIKKQNFDDVFTSEETKKQDWMDDFYVISTKELTVPESILHPEKWVQKSWDQDIDLEP